MLRTRNQRSRQKIYELRWIYLSGKKKDLRIVLATVRLPFFQFLRTSKLTLAIGQFVTRGVTTEVTNFPKFTSFSFDPVAEHRIRLKEIELKRSLEKLRNERKRPLLIPFVGDETIRKKKRFHRERHFVVGTSKVSTLSRERERVARVFLFVSFAERKQCN